MTLTRYDKLLILTFAMWLLASGAGAAVMYLVTGQLAWLFAPGASAVLLALAASFTEVVERRRRKRARRHGGN